MVTKNTMPIREGKKVSLKNNCKFTTAVDLDKSLKQFKLPTSLCTFATISELPSNISTMIDVPAIIPNRYSPKIV